MAQGNADAKVAVTAPTARKATNTDADNDQEEINPAEYRKNRMNSILEMQAQGFNPYPHKFHVSHRICDFVEQFSGCESNSRLVCRYAFILVTTCRKRLFLWREESHRSEDKASCFSAICLAMALRFKFWLICVVLKVPKTFSGSVPCSIEEILSALTEFPVDQRLASFPSCPAA